MKKCFKCDIEKPISEFYKHKKMIDGHLNKCMECAKKDVAKHRLKNIDKIREYDRCRGYRQPSEYIKEWKKRFPMKYKAQTMVSNYIRDGKLIRELYCEQCGSDWKIEAHHCDYSKPLDLMWLCNPCHKQWHAKHGEGLNGS